MKMKRYIMILIAVLLLGSRSVATEAPPSGSSSTCLTLFQSTCRTLIWALSEGIVERFGGAFLFTPHADGGGDGGGDGGAGGDGSGGDGSGGNGSAGDGRATDGGGKSGGKGG